MSDSHTVSHLITLAFMGGVATTLVCLWLHMGGGLYA